MEFIHISWIMDDDNFEMEMHDSDWGEVYDRQAARGDLTPRYCELLDLEPGDRVLELGSGPGYTTYRLANRVAPGDVFALDRHRSALRYLQRQEEQSQDHVHPIVGDVNSIPLSFSNPIPTIAAFLLHHVDSPKQAVKAIASAIPKDSPFLLVEYRANAAGEFGPPVEYRIPRSRATTWLSEAGFTLVEDTDFPEEKYGLVFRR